MKNKLLIAIAATLALIMVLSVSVACSQKSETVDPASLELIKPGVLNSRE